MAGSCDPHGEGAFFSDWTAELAAVAGGWEFAPSFPPPEEAVPADRGAPNLEDPTVGIVGGKTLCGAGLLRAQLLALCSPAPLNG